MKQYITIDAFGNRSNLDRNQDPKLLFIKNLITVYIIRHVKISSEGFNKIIVFVVCNGKYCLLY